LTSYFSTQSFTGFIEILISFSDDSDNTMTVIHPKESDSLLLECPLGGDESVSWKPPQTAVEELIEIDLNDKEIKLESVLVSLAIRLIN